MLSFQEFLKANTAPQYPHYTLTNNSNGTDWVITDIHGCSKTFKSLLGKIQLQVHDRLFLLGDYINKGPNSAGVLNIILQLLQEGLQVWPLRGNHEQMLLDDWDEGNPTFFFATRAKGETKQHIDRTTYENFLRKLPYYYELEDKILVHAGLDIAAADPLEAYEDMLWIRRMSERIGYAKQIIHGHEPMHLSFIEDVVSKPKERPYFENRHLKIEHLNINLRTDFGDTLIDPIILKISPPHILKNNFSLTMLAHLGFAPSTQADTKANPKCANYPPHQKILVTF